MTCVARRGARSVSIKKLLSFSPARFRTQTALAGLLLAAIPAGPGHAKALAFSGELRLGAEPDTDNGSYFYARARSRSTPIAHQLTAAWTQQPLGDKYRLSGRSQFNISHSFYYFGQLVTGANRADNIASERALIVSAGNSPFRRDRFGLAMEVGLGLTEIELDNALGPGLEGAASVALNAHTTLASVVKLELELAAMASSSKADLTGITAIGLRIAESLTLRIGYRARRVNFYDRPVKVRDEDTTLSLQYSF